jgi:hypothetical protein
MATISMTLKGVSPILMNQMTEETLDQLWSPGSKRKQRVQDITPKQAAESKLIRNEDGEIGIPVEYLFAALVYAGKFVKYDSRRNMSTADTSLVPSCIFLEGAFYPFKNQKEPWHVDKRRGVLRSGSAKGVAVAIVRPRIVNWEFDVVVEYDGDEIDVTKVRALFEAAGKKAGLGDFRPNCRGPFGRFIISRWDVIEQELAEAA